KTKMDSHIQLTLPPQIAQALQKYHTQTNPNQNQKTTLEKNHNKNSRKPPKTTRIPLTKKQFQPANPCQNTPNTQNHHNQK
ncbi:MAG: hypothetical protein KIH10_17860, partial [Candidatus Freyarchaeota archaeon]|nr:hypothetical protein [Candidatus Jordarchaeia archaeon]